MAKIKQFFEILKRGEKYFFKWTIKNRSNTEFNFKPGLLLVNRVHPYIHTRFKQLAFTSEKSIPAGKTLVMVNEELVADKVDNYRFYFHRYLNIGVEDNKSHIYFIPETQMQKLRKKIDDVAVEMGLPTTISEGLFLQLDEQDEQIAQIATQGGKMNSQPQIISIEMQEGFSENADKKQEDIVIEDRRD